MGGVKILIKIYRTLSACKNNFGNQGKAAKGVNSLPTGVKTLENYFKVFNMCNGLFVNNCMR